MSEKFKNSALKDALHKKMKALVVLPVEEAPDKARMAEKESSKESSRPSDKTK